MGVSGRGRGVWRQGVFGFDALAVALALRWRLDLFSFSRKNRRGGI
jgi:hypothetical protein